MAFGEILHCVQNDMAFAAFGEIFHFARIFALLALFAVGSTLD